MKNALFYLVVLFALGRPQLVQAEEPDLARLECPAPFEDGRLERYSRDHEVLVVAEPHPTNSVKDSLLVTGRNDQVLCFGLTTVARNYHHCGLMGVARSVSPGLYLFEEGSTKLRFTIDPQGAINLEPIGEGYKCHCGFHGVIEAGLYARQSNAS